MEFAEGVSFDLVTRPLSSISDPLDGQIRYPLETLLNSYFVLANLLQNRGGNKAQNTSSTLRSSSNTRRGLC